MRLRGSADDKVEVVKDELWLYYRHAASFIQGFAGFPVQQLVHLRIVHLRFCAFANLCVCACQHRDVNEHEKVGDAAPIRSHRGENDERSGKSRGW